MSINGTRKETKGWEISPSGRMVNVTGGDGVVLDEGVPVTESAFVRSEPPPLPGITKGSRAPEAKAPDTTAPDRARRSTLDLFNDEMAVMERPIEGDVEFVDEAPRPSSWRRVGVFAGIVVVMGLGGGLVLSRRHGAVEARAQVAPQPAPSPGAPAALAAPAPAEAPAAAADTATEDAAAAQTASSRADKVKAKAGGKHSRSSAKSSHHRSSKRTVAAKRSSSRHH